MEKIIKYKCDCGKEYETENEALACEAMHKYVITDIINEDNVYIFPEKICITNKITGRECKYRIDRPNSEISNLEWVMIDDIWDSMNDGDYYLIKDDDRIKLIKVHIYHPFIHGMRCRKLEFISCETGAKCMYFGYKYCCKIVLPQPYDDEDD